MRSETLPKIVIVVLATVVSAAAWLIQGPAPASHAFQSTPAEPVVIASEVLGRATPAAVENPELALGRGTIMPGAAIPVHYHAGTQIGVVVQGELTYTVISGEIALYRGDDPSTPPETIEPGETVVVRAGNALIESPGSVHQGRNEGDVPLVIYLCTLFPADAPRSIIVEATPAP